MKVFTAEELKLIIEKHKIWLDDGDGGERADLSSADLSSANLSFANLSSADLRFANLSSANLSSADFILVGQDIRGYLFYAYRDESGVVNIDAGCRHFVGVKAAREHWAVRHLGDTILHEDIQSLLARCERMAEVRGWKLNSNSE